MQWTLAAAFEPSLPPQCEPANDFLLQFSSTFHTCVPTPLGFISNTLGICSIIAWLFAQLPQIYKNWRISSTSGLSIFFLVEWCLGDFSNLLGALFTHQASWQVAIGCYYVFVDVCLVVQWFWYEKLRHGNMVRRVWRTGTDGSDGWSGGGMEEVLIEGVPVVNCASSRSSSHAAAFDQPKPKQTTQPQAIFRAPAFGTASKLDSEKQHSSLSATPNGTNIYRVGPSSSPIPSPSPRTILLLACLAAMAQASPLINPAQHSPKTSGDPPTSLENAGTILSWMSTVLYLGSRLPQLIKNWQRKSTAGLSPLLFAAAFCGNLFYSLALLTNPRAWDDFGPYGDGGWVGHEGSDRLKWSAAAMPFFLGAAGVLGLDASVGVQFLLYGEGRSKVCVVEDGRGRRWRWRRVSGWMRGWVPSISESKGGVQEALLERNDQCGEGYGAL
ncbi:hypothetical protein LTR37_018596 [Vermiconidia calcicola]|uniref:Uncharacterized protein n=1 Tax=Vermiconidia calcicola TaxID=1690605 RepID=A0ACC3MHQ1_9PEZI|nr:hypothetical protein LTR37_018596 [Vermiconidia calcicola]